MTLRLTNTLTRRLELFEPIEAGRVSVYCCGVTVYDLCHLGHARSYIAWDVLRRYLIWSGYRVTFVQNYTDIDDKILNRAAEEGSSMQAVSERNIEAFVADMARLNILPADRMPRATGSLDAIRALITDLEAKGAAYSADGDVYFAVMKHAGYGRLSGRDLSEQQDNAAGRVATEEEARKQHPFDFALWKGAKPGEPSWESPWGAGRPGWHIECSAMVREELGDTIDIHLGGADLIFPHHENEIAQSEGATGKPFVRHWMHVKHLFVEGRKMSKSLGNFIRVRELLEEGYDPAAIRHLLISSHYRGDLNFTRAGLEGSRAAVQRLLDFETRLAGVTVDAMAEASELPGLAEEARAAFRVAMDADFNSADALAAVFRFVSGVNAALDRRDAVRPADRDSALDALRSMDQVLGLLEVARAARSVDDDLAAWVEQKIEERAAARADRDFATADAIRQELAARNIVLEDGSGGTRWKVVS